ncbi:LysM peptidoglycan-binding domain-containing protein [uncultured Rikenella sp.]|uniref:PBP1 and LysM peptidoglycan-binding domain-containing protein n=1 Tax=uncultured Rikenella sp. TaxID=368003 RepID=UPI0025DB5228|nr:LysM peptidoglycan-binding domain-containing protein [uncultured Rikenella sp.]
MVIKRIFTLCICLLLSGVPLPDTVRAQTVVKVSTRGITMRGENYLLHKVKKGETLFAISEAYGVSEEEIMRANSLTRTTLRAKQTLLIPQAKQRVNKKQGTAATDPQQQQLPEPQIETPRPTVPPRTIPRPVPARTTEQVVLTHSDTLQTHGKGKRNPERGNPSQELSAAATSGFGANGLLHSRDAKAPIEAVVLLPLQEGLSSNHRFADYYRGILLGLNALKQDGISVNLRFLNTGAAEEMVERHIRSGALDRADLIIGPVYPIAFDTVANYAAQRGIAVVSPLGTVGADDNPYVYEASPDETHAFDRIFEQFGGRPGTVSEGDNLLVIDHVEHPDTATFSLIESQLGDAISTLSFSGERARSQDMDALLTAALERGRHNIVYVPVNRADALEGVLSHLSSLVSNGRYQMTVIGTPRWEWVQNINLDLFYKLNVHYPASYHADRSDPAVAAFYAEYLKEFGELPSPYAFRGYDVIRYFGGALNRFGAEMPERLQKESYRPNLLQVGYTFRQESDGGEQSGKFRNVAWPIVNFRPNYTIHVER